MIMTDTLTAAHEGNVSIGARVIVNIRFADDTARIAGETTELSGLVDQLDKTTKTYNTKTMQIFGKNKIKKKKKKKYHNMSFAWRHFAWNGKTCFLGKIRRIFQYVVCLETICMKYENLLSEKERKKY